MDIQIYIKWAILLKKNSKLIGKFKSCESGKYQCWITSATLSPSRNQLALLGSNKIWVFKIG